LSVSSPEIVFATVRTLDFGLPDWINGLGAVLARIVLPQDVIAAAPDVILASWCGKKVVPDKIRQRSGWDVIPAVRNDRIVEIKSALILQPGPAALTDGLDAILAALGRDAR
jgi:ABC-type Fe3+-hydroxamate transport system substrate-binding protein